MGISVYAFSKTNQKANSRCSCCNRQVCSKKRFLCSCADQLLYLTPRGLEIAVNYFRQQCDDKKSSGTFFTADDVKVLIVESGKKETSEERLAAVEQQRDELVLDLFIGYLEGDATEKLLQKNIKGWK